METLTFSQVCSIVQFFWLPSTLVILAIIRWVWKQIQPISTKYFEEKAKNLAQQQDLDRLTKIVESVKLEFQEQLESIKKQHTLEIEQYKAQLEQVKLVGRVQFEKEFQIYGKLWSCVIELQQAVALWNTGIQNILPPLKLQEMNSRIYEAEKNLVSIAAKNQPFYDETVYSFVNQIIRIMGELRLQSTTPKIERGEVYYQLSKEKKGELTGMINEVCAKIRGRINVMEVLQNDAR